VLVGLGAGALLLVLAVRHVLVPYRVVGSSMAPTLSAGIPEVVIVLRPAYLVRDPGRWDVVVVEDTSRNPPGESVKRVAGLPGETLEIRAGGLLVGGRSVALPRAIADCPIIQKGRFGHGPVELGRDEYFVTGDNSYASRDSRSWGPVRRAAITGQVLWVVCPWRRARWVE
jgi:signal peptidase I